VYHAPSPSWEPSSAVTQSLQHRSGRLRLCRQPVALETHWIHSSSIYKCVSGIAALVMLKCHCFPSSLPHRSKPLLYVRSPITCRRLSRVLGTSWPTLCSAICALLLRLRSTQALARAPTAATASLPRSTTSRAFVQLAAMLGGHLLVYFQTSPSVHHPRIRGMPKYTTTTRLRTSTGTKPRWDTACWTTRSFLTFDESSRRPSRMCMQCAGSSIARGVCCLEFCSQLLGQL
jgi:hypothetical protein